MCTEYVKFSFVCPCPNAHINCMCLRCEIQHVCEMTDRLCQRIASYIRQSSVSYSLSPLLNPTHDLQKAKVSEFTLYANIYRQRQRNRLSSSAICGFTYADIGTPAYTFCICIHWSFKGYEQTVVSVFG